MFLKNVVKSQETVKDSTFFCFIKQKTRMTKVLFKLFFLLNYYECSPTCARDKTGFLALKKAGEKKFPFFYRTHS
jgi:hypothetical protein